MKAVINYARIGKPLERYVEGLVEDNGRRLRTVSVLSSSDKFQPPWIDQGQRVGSIAKYLFYDEHFAVMELRDLDQRLLGYYCDVVSKLEKHGDEYFIRDFFLDLWLAPDGSMRELDWDEFHEASERGLLTTDEQRCATETLSRLRREAQSGTFPDAYIR
jgi:predicted RNA-binding protein associated with RNAse of E/G family